LSFLGFALWLGGILFYCLFFNFVCLFLFFPCFFVFPHLAHERLTFSTTKLKISPLIYIAKLLVNFPPTSYPLRRLKTLNTNSNQASVPKFFGSLGEGFAINGAPPRLAVLHPASTPSVQSRSQPERARIIIK